MLKSGGLRGGLTVAVVTLARCIHASCEKVAMVNMSNLTQSNRTS